ncbi:MAG: hypothetical protein MK086_10595 [Flavobacteriales bacterium]|nr:hypothetical protein [Flavobacteriales bacterium]
MSYSLNEVLGITSKSAFAQHYAERLSENPKGNVLLAELILCLDDLENAKPSWFDKFDTQVVVDFLVISHRHYSQSILPSIARQIELLVKQPDCPALISEYGMYFFKEFCSGLELHFEYEENHLFPYVLKMNDEKDKLKRSFNEEEFNQHHPHPPVDLNSLLMLMNSTSETLEKSMSHRILIEKLESLSRELGLHEFIEANVLLPRIAK